MGGSSSGGGSGGTSGGEATDSWDTLESMDVVGADDGGDSPYSPHTPPLDGMAGGLGGVGGGVLGASMGGSAPVVDYSRRLRRRGSNGSGGRALFDRSLRPREKTGERFLM